MTVGEVLEAAAIVAQNGRPGDCLPLLKHVCVRFGLRVAAEAPELPLLVNALAGNRRLRPESQQVWEDGLMCGFVARVWILLSLLCPVLNPTYPLPCTHSQACKPHIAGSAVRLPSAHPTPATPKVPPGCKPHIAALLIAATRSQQDPDYLSQQLSAAGKRMAIEVCFSQVRTRRGGEGRERVVLEISQPSIRRTCWLRIRAP